MKIPSDNLIRSAAYFRWEKCGKESGNDLFYYYEAQRDLILALNYTVVCRYFLDDNQPAYLGTEQGPCRYCKKQYSSSEFQEHSHAIPASIGNKSLFDYNECDSCNHLFGDGIDQDFGNFTNLLRTCLNITGRTKIPAYQKGNLLIKHDHDKLHIKYNPYDNTVTIDAVSNSAAVASEIPAFSPLGAYKAFAKMALSMLPKEYLQYFDQTINWIVTSDHSVHAKNFIDHFLYILFNPRHAFDRPWATLLRRNKDGVRLPYLIFVLGSSNITFQVFVPFSNNDDHLEGQVYFPRLGLHVGSDRNLGTPQFFQIPLTSAEKISPLMTIRWESLA